MEEERVFEHFAGEAIITGLDSVVKSGKEATVFKCVAHPSTGVDYVAVKIYKDIEERSFKNMNGYLDGRLGRSIRGRRDILHMMADPGSKQAFWVDAEYGALVTLRDAGLRVPKAFGRNSSAIAMEFVGDPSDPAASAPRLRDAALGPGDAQRVLDSALGSIVAMLSLDLIHGDLSPYNVLMKGHEPVIIDFPQVVDARYHSQAEEMLLRDVVNVCGFLEKRGARMERSAADFTRGLWRRYERNELYAGTNYAESL